MLVACDMRRNDSAEEAVTPSAKYRRIIHEVGTHLEIPSPLLENELGLNFTSLRLSWLAAERDPPTPRRVLCSRNCQEQRHDYSFRTALALEPRRPTGAHSLLEAVGGPTGQPGSEQSRHRSHRRRTHQSSNGHRVFGRSFRREKKLFWSEALAARSHRQSTVGESGLSVHHQTIRRVA